VKKQLAIVAGVLFALSTAVATDAGNETRAAKPAASQAAASDLGTQAAVQIVSLWKDHANTAASTPLARPL
jgi:hypothetical protein